MYPSAKAEEMENTDPCPDAKKQNRYRLFRAVFNLSELKSYIYIEYSVIQTITRSNNALKHKCLIYQ